jgi:hypothetical protein
MMWTPSRALSPAFLFAANDAHRAMPHATTKRLDRTRDRRHGGLNRTIAGGRGTL